MIVTFLTPFSQMMRDDEGLVGVRVVRLAQEGADQVFDILFSLDLPHFLRSLAAKSLKLCISEF